MILIIPIMIIWTCISFMLAIIAIAGGILVVVTEKIKKAMYETAKQFVYIGFLLWEVQEYGYYSEKGYADVYEYAETELGFKRSSTKNFIAINIKFGSREVKDGWNMMIRLMKENTENPGRRYK